MSSRFISTRRPHLLEPCRSALFTADALVYNHTILTLIISLSLYSFGEYLRSSNPRLILPLFLLLHQNARRTA